MTDKKIISYCINQFLHGDLRANSLALFGALGYQSTLTFSSPISIDNIFNFDSEKVLKDEWLDAPFLFQLTESNLSNIQSLFTEVDGTIIESYMFVAIELEKSEYSRTQLVTITRELNKRSPQPILILFKHGETLTLSVIHRRLHKRDDSKDVLEKVTLLKDIRINDPHRAHIDILSDLAFDNLNLKANASFVDLHNAWQTVLDTKTLNKQFYKELSQWYFWAMKETYFPDAENIEAVKGGIFEDPIKVREHNAKNLIRLLTRILFVWFIKEKNLIPEELFDENWITKQLNGFHPKPNENKKANFQGNESHYYRAILQNLFFATLNQVIDKRGFRNEGQHRNVTNLMRYQSYFTDSSVFLDLVTEVVPFMNGGLFDCLDKVVPDVKGKQGGDVIAYEDGFSDRVDNKLRVPDYIFFGAHKNVDLSEELGNKQKSVEIKGLVDILKSYKFTITENTPIEEDIALDPELLGQVFENLLASYNPETKTTARKQTGSFYTPREIVDYMVDESLKAYFKSKLDYLTAEQLDDLLSYTKATPEFSESEKTALIEAIDTCKILDPACGSGAFPMGVLHKLVFILGKIDPDNELWKQRQIKEKDSALQKRIIEAFTDNEVDYARKLYLIENCIYGVDIQAIAIQISKLRFFISLIVDQKVNRNKTNFGVLPLPNLETKFVAANTLIGIEKPKAQITLFDNKEIEALEEKLKKVRHSLFSVRSRSRKTELHEEDKQLREQIGALLEQHGWGNETAQQLAHWSPYDQNANADFFDVEWMFGLSGGFDIVIGNPPYVRADNPAIAKQRLLITQSKQYETLWEKWDLMIPFYEKTLKTLKANGVHTFVVSNSITTSKYAQLLQDWILKNYQVKSIDYFNDIKTFDAGVIPVITIIQNTKSLTKTVKNFRKDSFENVSTIEIDLKTTLENLKIKIFKQSFSDMFNPEIEKELFGDICYMSKGMVTNADEKEAQGEFVKNDLISDEKTELHSKQYIEGKNLKAYVIEKIRYIEWNSPRVPEGLSRPTFRALYDGEKILRGRVTKGTIDDTGIVCNDSIIVMKRFVDLKGLEERSITTSIAKNNLSDDDKKASSNKKAIVNKKRQELENISLAYPLKFVLAIINSKYAMAFLNNFRRHRLENYFYPDDFRNFPIPKIPETEQQPFIKLVDKILAEKKAGNDTSELEREIDVLVYGLYGLTDEEILIVEGK